MGLQSDGRAALIRRQKQAAGVSVTYTQAGSGLSAVLTAVPGATAFVSAADGGKRIEVGNRDYLIAVADLVINGAPTAPAIGDTVTETINGVATVFEVQMPDNGEQAVRFSTQARDLYRLHCKRLS